LQQPKGCCKPCIKRRYRLPANGLATEIAGTDYLNGILVFYTDHRMGIIDFFSFRPPLGGTFGSKPVGPVIQIDHKHSKIFNIRKNSLLIGGR
jgi:hypothetical protein